MIINHNLQAINTHHQMFGVMSKQGKSMEKLSSGLRINRAGDDAAGLAISEKMRSQIRGLNQASRNAQDGISLIQTAEGALGETHNILQRMRELAVQSANGTNESDDRQKIQDEIDELKKEVDRIGNDTEFNHKRLLNDGAPVGGEVKPELKKEIIDGMKTHGWLKSAEKLVEDVYGLKGDGSKELVVSIENKDGTGNVLATGGAVFVGDNVDHLTMNLDAADFDMIDDGADSNGKNKLGNMYNDRIIAHEMTHAIMYDQLGADTMDKLGHWFKEGTAELIHGADNRVKNQILSGGAVDASKATNFANHAKGLLDGTVTWGGDSSADYAASYALASYMDVQLRISGESDGIKSVMTDLMKVGGIPLKRTPDFSKVSKFIEGFKNADAKKVEKTVADFKDYISNAGDYADKAGASATDKAFYGMKLTDTDTGSYLGTDHGGLTKTAESVVAASSGGTAHYTIVYPKVDGSTSGVKTTSPASAGSSTSIKLQIGANANQTLEVKLEDARAAALGIDGANVEVTDHSKSAASLEKLDHAISQVSNFRSRLGAYQNRLEHSIKNLNSSSENLTAAESRIRDVDMAKEMMDLTKQKILMQASQFMLAQANQNPQGVLSLLR